MDLHATMLDTARHRVPTRAPTSASHSQGHPHPRAQQLGAGDRRRCLPPRPPPPPTGETRGGGAGKADEVLPRGTRDTRHGSGVATRDAAAAAAGGGGGVPGVARKGKAKGVAELGGERCLGLAEEKGAGDAGRKRGLGLAAFPPAPPPKRRPVSGTRRSAPGRGRDAAAAPVGAGEYDDSRLVVARADDGASGALEKTAPPVPVGKAGSSVVQVESSAEVVSAPIADSGRHGLQRSSEPLRQSGVPSADGLLDTDSPGDAAKELLVPATRRRLLPKPRMVSAVRRFPPGSGRAGTSLVAGGGTGVRLPLPEKVMSTDCSTFAAEQRAMKIAAVSCNAASTDRAAQEEEFMAGEIAAPKLQQPLGSQSCANVTLHESAACRDGPSVPAISLQSQEKRPSCVAAKDTKVVIKSAGSSSNALAQSSLSEGPSKKHNVASAKMGSVPSTSGFLDTDSQGDAGSAGFVRKELVPATRRLLLKPRMVSAVRRFPPGCGSARTSLVAGGGNTGVCLPLPEKVVATDCSTFAADKSALQNVAIPCNPTITDRAGQKVEFVEGEIASPKVQQPQGSQSCTNVTLDESVACRDGPSVPAISLQSQEKRPSRVVEKGVKVMIKSAGSSSNALAQSLSAGPSKESVVSTKMGRAISGVAPSASGQGAMRRNKVMSAARKEAGPAKSIQKSASVCHPRLFFKIKKTEHGRCVTMNGSEDTAGFAKQRVVQDPTSGNKCLQTDREAVATSMNSFGPKKKGNVKQKSMLPSNVEDDILKSLAAHEEKYGVQNVDARSKMKMLIRRFEFIRRSIVRAMKQQSLKLPRIDLAAADLIKKTPGFTQCEPIVGNVPGIEVGDEFLYRVELNIVGLHRPYQAGIDTIRDKYNVLIAISIVASGGYPDQLSRSGELIYTGSGGKISGKKGVGDQKLEKGNLALKNCIQTKTPVRVIHRFKGLSREEGNHSSAEETPMFTYDGLYNVVDCWREGQPGSKVIKYKLQRIAGQAELHYGSETSHGGKCGITG